MKACRDLNDRNCQSCPVRREGLFCDLSAETLNDLTAVKQSFAYPPGAFLFFEDEANRGIFILCSGQVKLSISSTAGRTLILKISNPGDVIGLASTLDGSPYELTAEVLQSASISFLRKDDFQRLCATRADFNQAVIRQMNRQYSAACEQLRTIGLCSSAPQKMARLLLNWSANGRTTEEGIKINVPLTHEQMAECVGSTRETVTRTLSEFKHKGLIFLIGATVLIPNRAALEAVSGVS
jgi:CRP/FNR family transcriptional regulator, cyclic AMP receptor protein